jgi:hypothetical protein
MACRRMSTLLPWEREPPVRRPEGFSRSPSTQGLTLVHFSAQLEPFRTRNLSRFGHPMLAPATPYEPPKQPLNAPTVPQKALTLSRKANECKPLPVAVTVTVINLAGM